MGCTIKPPSRCLPEACCLTSQSTPVAHAHTHTHVQCLPHRFWLWRRTRGLCWGCLDLLQPFTWVQFLTAGGGPTWSCTIVCMHEAAYWLSFVWWLHAWCGMFVAPGFFFAMLCTALTLWPGCGRKGRNVWDTLIVDPFACESLCITALTRGCTCCKVYRRRLTFPTSASG